jgi:hypothetical protein
MLWILGPLTYVCAAALWRWKVDAHRIGWHATAIESILPRPSRVRGMHLKGQLCGLRSAAGGWLNCLLDACQAASLARICGPCAAHSLHGRACHTSCAWKLPSYVWVTFCKLGELQRLHDAMVINF